MTGHLAWSYGVPSIMLKIPEISVGIQMEKFVFVLPTGIGPL